MARVEVAVVVVVEEQRAESDERQGFAADAALDRDVREQSLAEIAKQRVRLELVVGHEQIQPAVAIEVAEVGAHAGARHAVARHRHAGGQRRPP